MSAISTSSSPLRALFLFEAAATFIGGTALLLAPATVLRLATNPTITFPMTQTSEPSPSSIQLMQWLGACHYILCMPLVLGAAENARAKASRRITYITLGSGELFLAILTLWQAQGPSVAGAMTRKALFVTAANMVSILLARGWVLGFKPEWFDDVKTPSHKRRSSNR